MITFFYPSVGPGGAQNIIVRLGEEFQRRGIPFRLWDNSTGWIRKRFIDLSVEDYEWINYDHYRKAFQFSGPDDFFLGFQSHLLTYPMLMKSCSSTVAFWDVLKSFWLTYGRCRQIPLVNPLLRNSSKKLLNEIVRLKSIAFIEKEGVDYLRSNFDVNTDTVSTIPIPIEVFDKGYSLCSLNKWIPLQICYLGRPDVWKVTPFNKIIDDIEQTNFDFEIQITVITSSVNEFKKHMLRDPSTYSFKINFIENLYGNNLDIYIKNNVHLLFAMGTSCLEGGKLKVPTCIIDYSNNKFPETYKYRWLYESTGYCLGKDLSSNLVSESIGVSMKELIENLIDNHEKIANLCFKYVKDNHSIHNVANKFLDFQKQSTFPANNLNNYITSRFVTSRFIVRKAIRSCQDAICSLK